MMNVFKAIIEGVWNNVLNKTVTIDTYSFKVWIPSALVIILALIFRFMGGGKTE